MHCAIDRQFQTVIGTLQALSTSASIDAADYRQFHQDASRVMATQPQWFAIILLSTDGQQMVNTRLPWGTPLLDAAEPESLRRVVATQQPAVGSIRQPQRGGSDLVFAVRVPVQRDGRMRFVLTGVMRVGMLDSVVPAPSHEAQEWTRSIIDPDGTIAVRTRGSEGYVGTKSPPAFLERLQRTPESVTRETTREGLAVYAASSRSTDGWSAVVVVPRDALDGPLRTSLLQPGARRRAGDAGWLCGVRLRIPAAVRRPRRRDHRGGGCRRGTARWCGLPRTRWRPSGCSSRSPPPPRSSNDVPLNATSSCDAPMPRLPPRKRRTARRISSSRCLVTSCAIRWRQR